MILRAVGLKVREVMVERGVYDGIALSSTSTKAFEVFDITAMCFCSGRYELFSASIGAGEAEHFMALPDKFRDDM